MVKYFILYSEKNRWKYELLKIVAYYIQGSVKILTFMSENV